MIKRVPWGLKFDLRSESQMRSRCSTGRRALPSSVVVAGRSRDAETPPADPASGRHCAVSGDALQHLAVAGSWSSAATMPRGFGQQGPNLFPMASGQQPTVSRHRPNPRAGSRPRVGGIERIH